MPMHDWTRVDPNDYHDFDGSWIFAVRHALNNGVLPSGYFALAEHTVPPFVPDVVTLSIPDDPPRGVGTHSGSAVADYPKSAIVLTETGKRIRPPGRRRVVVQHAKNRQIVAVIELVSPSNKEKKPEFADLLGKTVLLLRQGIHVLIIDPFPPTRRDPNGIHASIWKELTGKPFTPPENKPLTLASYVALGANTFTAIVEPLAVGDPIPTMPLFLTDEFRVPVPLESTYEVAMSGFPAPLRAIVEGR